MPSRQIPGRGRLTALLTVICLAVFSVVSALPAVFSAAAAADDLTTILQNPTCVTSDGSKTNAILNGIVESGSDTTLSFWARETSQSDPNPWEAVGSPVDVKAGAGIAINSFSKNYFSAGKTYDLVIAPADDAPASDVTPTLPFAAPSSPESTLAAVVKGVPNSVFTGQTFKVYGAASTGSTVDCPVTKYTWKANGVEQNGDTATFTFTNAGKVNIKLTVTDATGEKDSSTAEVDVVANKPPVAKFNATTDGLKVFVDGSPSTDADNGIVSYKWDFNGEATSNKMADSHKFKKAGKKKITLTVTDKYGLKNSTSQTITVNKPESNSGGSGGSSSGGSSGSGSSGSSGSSSGSDDYGYDYGNSYSYSGGSDSGSSGYSYGSGSSYYDYNSGSSSSSSSGSSSSSSRSGSSTYSSGSTISGTEGPLALGFASAVGTPINGAKITVSGSGLLPGSDVTVEAHSDPVQVGQASVSNDGTLSTTLTIPVKLPAGEHQLIADGLDKNGIPVSQAIPFGVDDQGRFIGTGSSAASAAGSSSGSSTSSGSVATFGVLAAPSAVDTGYRLFGPAANPVGMAIVGVVAFAFLSVLAGRILEAGERDDEELAVSGALPESTFVPVDVSEPVTVGATTSALAEVPEKPASTSWADRPSVNNPHRGFAPAEDLEVITDDESGDDEESGKSRIPLVGGLFSWLAGVMPSSVRKASPLLDEIVRDGGWLRSLLGSIWIVLPVGALGAGIAAAVLNHGNAVPPALGFVFAIAVLGILDASVGLLAFIGFAVTTTVMGGIIAPSSIRILLGIAALWVLVPVLALATRSLRREDSDELGFGPVFDRVGDVVIVAATAGLLGYATVSSWSTLSGLDLPIVSDAALFGVAAAAVMIARALVSRAFANANRLTTSRDDAPNDIQRIVSMLVRTALFGFIAVAFVGNCWQLWVGVALFLVPLLLAVFPEWLPKSSRLRPYIPTGYLRLALLLIIGSAIAYAVLHNVTNPQNALAWLLVGLAIPYAILGVITQLVQPGPGWQMNWIQRGVGIAVFVLAAAALTFI